MKFSQELVLNQWMLERFEVETRCSDPGWRTEGLTKAQFEARHVFFQKEDPDT